MKLVLTFLALGYCDLKSGLSNVYPLISDFFNNEPKDHFFSTLVDPAYEELFGEPKVFPQNGKSMLLLRVRCNILDDVQELLDEISAIYKPLQKDQSVKWPSL